MHTIQIVLIILLTILTGTFAATHGQPGLPAVAHVAGVPSSLTGLLATPATGMPYLPAAGALQAAASPHAGPEIAPEPATQPNIIFLYTDDHGTWATGRENPQAHTPNMDRLYREGAGLTNAFVTTPVCSPSRASLLTGRYATELGVYDWIDGDEDEVGLDPQHPTWVRKLQQAGYATALVGKWHLGNTDRFHPTRFGYDEFTGMRRHGPPADPLLEKDGELRNFEGLTIDILADHVIDFIRKNREGPFLISWHTRSPHRSWLPVAEEDWAPYEGIDPAIPNYPGLDEDRVRRMMREYLASVTAIDRNLGRVLQVLQELGLTGNSVVIFTANEGNSLGHHGMWGKGNAVSVLRHPPPGTETIPGNRRPNLLDTSLRVPTVVRWPGIIPAGSLVKQTVSNLDWFPTLLAMAGLKVPEDVEQHGRNFLPLLRGESEGHWVNELYAEYSPHHGIRADMRAWRTPRWKLVRDFRNPWRDEFYDLENDPKQRNNLIFDSRFEVRMALQALSARIVDQMRRLNDPVLDQTDDARKE